VEGLNWVLEEDRKKISFHGISFGGLVRLTLLFVNDAPISFRCVAANCLILKNKMTLFSAAK